MSQVLGALWLLDFTILRPVLAWRAFRNLWTLCFFNFLIFFWPQWTADTESVDTGARLIYRVSQEEWIKLGESVPFVKLYRYNPKHLYPKLNGYGDNGHRKVWCSLQFHAPYLVRDVIAVHCSCPPLRVTHCLCLKAATHAPFCSPSCLCSFKTEVKTERVWYQNDRLSVRLPS
jgi:hypothetical protein